MKSSIIMSGALLGALLLGGCVPAASPPSTTPSATAAADPSASAVAVRDIYVYKSPTCSCCHEWEAYMTAAGYVVHSIPTDDTGRIKKDVGVPQAAWSCHTAVIGGYFVEGHVPLAAIEDMLSKRPAIDGIALPGMPAGSPGMPGVKAAPFEVLAVVNGTTSVFGSY